MDEFFSFWYKNNLYGEHLYYHLRGWSDAEQGFIAASDKFPIIFSITAGTAIICFLLYYYIFNHPKYNRWYHWLFPLIICLIQGYALGYIIIINDINAEVIAESLIKYISTTNAIFFGIYNGIIGGLIFCGLSFLLRRWSRNCKHSPFTLITTRLNNKGKQDHE